METNSTPEHIGRSKSLTETVVERLRGEIIDGTIEWGAMLSEKALAEKYGVSKTPVREALVRLQSAGLVTILPQRGGLVFFPDVDEVRDLYEVRRELEAAALRLAIARNPKDLARNLQQIVDAMEDVFDTAGSAAYQELDGAFHLAFFTHCGNRLLSKTYASFASQIAAIRTRVSSGQPYLLTRSLEEHRLLVGFVAAGDCPSALAVLQEHIARTEHVHVGVIANRQISKQACTS